MTNKTLEEKYIARIKFGNKLLVAAWFLVITQAIIGLVVAWFMSSFAYEFYTENGVDLPPEKWSDILLAGSLFVIFSSIELLKIPLVSKIYKSQRLIRKFFYAIVLIGVTLITFQIVFLGSVIYIGEQTAYKWHWYYVSFAGIVSSMPILIAAGGLQLKKKNS